MDGGFIRKKLTAFEIPKRKRKRKGKKKPSILFGSPEIVVRAEPAIKPLSVRSKHGNNPKNGGGQAGKPFEDPVEDG